MNRKAILNCDIADFDTLGIKRRDILIEGDRIAKISEKLTAEEKDGAEVLDAKGMLAIPGLFDCQTHMGQSMLKGPADDYPITDWLVRMFTCCDLMTEEDTYYAGLLGCLSSLKFGTTTINEMSNWQFVDPMLQAFEDSGLRAVFGISTTDIAENEETPVLTIEEALRRSESVYQRAHGRGKGRIRASVAPAGLPACSRDLCKELKKFANDRGLLYHTHLGEGKKETEDVMRMYGLSGEAQALYDFGLLDDRTVLAHSIWLQDHELDLIAETGAHPVHCPCTNMKISDGIPKIGQMLRKGIPVAMGCDGEASSSNRDIIRETRTGAYLQKVVMRDPTVMDAGTCFKMMTINGAKALGYEDLGEIKEGAIADIVLADMDSDLSVLDPEYRVGNLLYAADGHYVDTVLIAGEVKLRQKKFTDFDEEELIEKARGIISGLNKKIAML